MFVINKVWVVKHTAESGISFLCFYFHFLNVDLHVYVWFELCCVQTTTHCAGVQVILKTSCSVLHHNFHFVNYQRHCFWSVCLSSACLSVCTPGHPSFYKLQSCQFWHKGSFHFWSKVVRFSEVPSGEIKVIDLVTLTL